MATIVYRSVPTRAQWQTATGDGLSGAGSSQQVILELLDTYDGLRTGPRDAPRLFEVGYLLHNALMRSLKAQDKGKVGKLLKAESSQGLLSRAKSNIVHAVGQSTGEDKRRGHVLALTNFIESEFQSVFHCSPSALRDKQVDFFDSDAQLNTFFRGVDQHARQNDTDRVQRGGLDWVDDATERKRHKISFRNGRAFKWVWNTSGTKVAPTQRYNSKSDEPEVSQATSFGGSLYAMDTSGRLYAWRGSGSKALHHSSFLAGNFVMCAGTICFVDGKLSWISGDSGHYKPTGRQLLRAMTVLRQHGVSLADAWVYRQARSALKNPPNGAPPEFRNQGVEVCRATAFLDAGGWPVGDPNSLYAG
jgi:hypothetical protein